MRKILILAGFLFLIPSFAKAQSCTVHATTSNFSSQLSTAGAGQVICLAPGNYGTFSGVSKSGFVTIESDASAGGTQANVIFSGINFPGGTYYNTLQNMTVGGGEIGTYQGSAAVHVHFVQIMFTGSLCIETPQNVNQDTLVDQSFFGDVGQSCTEGRLGIRGNGGNSTTNGVVISNTTFQGPLSGSNGADGIQINGGASGTHIGPGNTFDRIIQQFCGSVHCDSIQFYGASNTVVDGNYFYDDSDAIMSPDCNGTPFTFTNNVIVGNDGQQLMIGGGNGDVFDHNTFSTVNGGYIRFGNPNNCGLSSNETVTNNIMPSGVNLTEGQSTSSFKMSYNLCQSSCGGSNSLTGSASYSGGSNPNTYSGYTLTSSSLGHLAASNGTDLGIITSTSSSGSTAPAPPTNLGVIVQ